MKLHGRITVFGEYLLKDNLSYCLCIKSKLFLSNDKVDSTFIHSNYEVENDRTILLLQQIGINHFSKIYGNLPLGYGLASSTVLSLLHLNSVHRKDLIEIIDEEINGFPPSELDYVSITKQETGIFGFGLWQPMLEYHPHYSLIITPKERKRKLSDVKKELSIAQEKQISITQILFSELSVKGELNLLVFLEYCELLLAYDVYSTNAREIISVLIQKKIASKCIGGLYDKAILVMHKTEAEKMECDEFILTNFNYAIIVE